MPTQTLFHLTGTVVSRHQSVDLPIDHFFTDNGLLTETIATLFLDTLFSHAHAKFRLLTITHIPELVSANEPSCSNTIVINIHNIDMDDRETLVRNISSAMDCMYAISKFVKIDVSSETVRLIVESKKLIVRE